jgi:hypothetical protein
MDDRNGIPETLRGFSFFGQNTAYYRLIAAEKHLQRRFARAYRIKNAFDRYPASEVSAFNVNGETNFFHKPSGAGLLFGRLYFYTCVIAAISAYAVRDRGLLAMRTQQRSRRLYREMTAPFVSPGLGMSLLGNCHILLLTR